MEREREERREKVWWESERESGEGSVYFVNDGHVKWIEEREEKNNSTVMMVLQLLGDWLTLWGPCYFGRQIVKRQIFNGADYCSNTTNARKWARGGFVGRSSETCTYLEKYPLSHETENYDRSVIFPQLIEWPSNAGIRCGAKNGYKHNRNSYDGLFAPINPYHNFIFFLIISLP